MSLNDRKLGQREKQIVGRAHVFGEKRVLIFTRSMLKVKALMT